MIVVRLMGGLGNQLFQYAAAKQLSILNNAELYFDTSFFTTTSDRYIHHANLN
jgi:hypothetical protein